VKLRWKLVGELGVRRHSGYRALKALKAAGLISVVRQPGRSPVVTLCDCPVGGQDAIGLRSNLAGKS
jgi:hypothetical protein